MFVCKMIVGFGKISAKLFGTVVELVSGSLDSLCRDSSLFLSFNNLNPILITLKFIRLAKYLFLFICYFLCNVDMSKV